MKTNEEGNISKAIKIASLAAGYLIWLKLDEKLSWMEGDSQLGSAIYFALTITIAILPFSLTLLKWGGDGLIKRILFLPFRLLGLFAILTALYYWLS